MITERFEKELERKASEVDSISKWEVAAKRAKQ
jgi:hypothetical protein